MDIEYLKGTTIERPMTPSQWIDKDYKKITRLLMSCGGGMGGIKWYEYVEREDDIEPDSIQTFVDAITGKRKRLNTRFLVVADDFTLVIARLDNKNENYPLGETNYYYLTEDDVIIKLK